LNPYGASFDIKKPPTKLNALDRGMTVQKIVKAIQKFRRGPPPMVQLKNRKQHKQFVAKFQEAFPGIHDMVISKDYNAKGLIVLLKAFKAGVFTKDPWKNKLDVIAGKAKPLPQQVSTAKKPLHKAAGPEGGAELALAKN